MRVWRRSSGVVVILARAPEPRYLLLRAYRNWDFPKGAGEPGEAPLETALRELREETTLTDLRFLWGLSYHETPPYNNGKIARYYLAESPSAEVSLPVNPALGRPEHHEYRWLPYAGARPLLPSRLVPVLDWARDTTAAQYRQAPG
ncbi:MAG TPA: NUDIX domain-containing protein [Acidiferrobacteraceae bacterium]|nr:NUDIX domain-containing protein [Acidiferrobacteraceae bacterium]